MRRSNGLPRGRVHTVVFAICVSFLSACSTFDRGSPVPPADKHEVTVLGLPNARFFVDQPGAISAEQERALIREARTSRRRPRGYLADCAYSVALWRRR